MKNTLISVWRIACFAAILALTGCAATPPILESFSHKEIRHPAPLITSTAAKGQPIYLHYDYDSLITYRLQEPLEKRIVFNKIVVSSQERLYRGILKHKNVLCTESLTFIDLVSGPMSISCFIDEGRTGKVETVTIASAAGIWSSFSIGRSIAYYEEELFSNKAQPLKRELIFTGYSEGQLTLLYRVYQSDPLTMTMGKVTLNQPLVVPVESFPTKKEIKGLSIEFLSATDAQVSYKILAGFQP